MNGQQCFIAISRHSVGLCEAGYYFWSILHHFGIPVSTEEVDQELGSSVQIKSL